MAARLQGCQSGACKGAPSWNVNGKRGLGWRGNYVDCTIGSSPLWPTRHKGRTNAKQAVVVIWPAVGHSEGGEVKSDVNQIKIQKCPPVSLQAAAAHWAQARKGPLVSE